MATRTARNRPVSDRTTRPVRTRPIPDPVEDEPGPVFPAETQPEPVVTRPQRVLIDGIAYTPATQADTGQPRVGVAITTHNRNKLLGQLLDSLRAHTPADFPIMVVDDASDKPVDGADYRFDQRAGVAAAKNKCLELLMGRTQVDHLFLLDDDIQVRVDDWWRPYVESPEPHLAHSWGLQPLWRDSHHVAWHASGGTVLYYRRDVIADVGGMRTDFGEDGQPAWGCEHVNLSDRIHNRGWTTWRYADIAGSEKLFRELDREPGHKSTATTRQKDHNRNVGRPLWMERLDDTDYIEYRDRDDVILTCLFTGTSAAKSGRGYRADTRALSALAASIQHGRLVVFHDQLKDPKLTTGNGEPVEFVQTDCKINVFYQRHQSAWQWLREHPEVGKVWAVDGTDVQQLRDPFEPIQPGKIHLGWEPVTQESQWLREHHPERRVQEFMAANPTLQLLNAGLIGGDRETVMAFLHGLVKYYYDVQIDHAQVWQPRSQAVVGAGDMCALNLVAYTEFGDRIVTGTHVSTVFKAFDADKGEFSLWRHK